MSDNPETPFDPFVKQRRWYTEILTNYLPIELLQRNGTIRAISIGGAEGLEGQALIELAKIINPGLNIYFEALDLDEGGIRKSRRMNPNVPAENFKVADATDIQSFGLEPWDLIIIRNPNLKTGVITWKEGGGHENWNTIFQNSIDKLSPGGYLFITNYDEDEQQLTLDMLKSEKNFPELQILHLNSNKTSSLSKKGTGFMLERTASVFRKL